MTEKPKLLMLKGLPASGKSTYARELVDQGWVRVNKDDLRRMMDNSKYTKGNENRVLKIRDEIVINAITAGKSVVVDDTNFEEKHEERLRFLAGVNADFSVLFIDTPLEECIKRNEKRADKVPLYVIMDMYKRHIGLYRDEPVEQDRNLDECIIVDIDGTLAHINDANPRDVYDGSRVSEDLLDEAVANVVGMAYQNGYKVIILTGRKAAYIEDTKAWLEDMGVNYDELYSRADGDDRPDQDIKEELWRTHILGRYYTKYIIDDRPRVCRMWRSLGLKTFQVGDPYVEF